MKGWLGLFVLSLVLLSCDEPITSGNLVLNDTLSIGYHDVFTNETENIRISFDSLLEDSRCPIGVQCYWEGNARLQFTFDSVAFALNTYHGYARDTTLSNYNIILVRVNPYPVYGKCILPTQYVADVVVTRVDNIY